MEPHKITRPGQAYEEPHIGSQLAKKLDTHRWHVLRHSFDNEPQPETYEAVVATKTVTPNAIKKLLAKAWCARQIMWPNRQNGIVVEFKSDNYGEWLAILWLKVVSITLLASLVPGSR